MDIIKHLSYSCSLRNAKDLLKFSLRTLHSGTQYDTIGTQFTQEELSMEQKEEIIHWIERNRSAFIEIAESIWNHPEVSYQEEKASSLQKKYLRDAGFRIRELDDIQRYAFIAEAGKGEPVIGLLGEFDALPGLSQKVSPFPDPVVPGGPGHGCGHNLLGTACLAAAESVKELLEKGRLKGTIRYYGCPAEEQLGKPILARSGVFSDLDAALCWHPADINTVAAYSTNASIEVSFHFTGKPAHAAQVPHLGRSALDALTLMGIGVEFLREHMPSSARVHYIYTSTGERPNIVPAYASGSFQVRSPRMKDVLPLLQRVIDIAKGAALMTDTQVTYKALQGCYDILPNSVISDLLYTNMQKAVLPRYDAAELEFARKLASTFTEDQKRNTLIGLGLDGITADQLLKQIIHEGIGYWGKGWPIPSSTDVGDVSHIIPTAQINAATYPIGIGSHTWQATAASGSSIGMKGMLYAAQVLGATVCDLMERPSLIEQAKNEFDTVTRGDKYTAAMDMLDS
jgi:aminobenzoyl-glutamate utilization protein B